MAGEGPARALDGLRVLEVGQLLAGPFAGALLAYHGAEVIKVEPPGGDALRGWRGIEGGTSVWWRSLSRNKRCVVVDLHAASGRDLVRRLALRSDVLLENFRPGTMEGWGLGPEALLGEAPGLVFARVSGFGQTGPDRDRAGFASVCEAAAGLRHLTGMPGAPPVRPNLSLGDTLGGLHATIGLLLALLHRERTGRGQVVDVALTESILGVLEAVLPEYERLGTVRGPSGPTITGVAPSNAYACADGRRVVVGANTDRLFSTLMRAIDRADLAADPSLGSNAGRVVRVADLDAAIEAWTSSRPSDEVLFVLRRAGVPASGVADAADLLADPHFQARGIMEPVAGSPDGERLPAMFPRLTETPGWNAWAGPALGAHTDEVLAELGVGAEELAALRAAGVVV